MKKRKLFTIGLIAVALIFTGCNDDDDDDPDPVLGPSLEVVETNTGSDGGGDVIIAQGESLQFAWDARKGAEDMETFDVVVTGVNNPSSLPMSSEGQTFPYDMDSDDDEVYVDTLTFINAGTSIGVTNYTFTVTSEDGTQTSVSFDVTVEMSAEVLETFDFTWVRDGADPATGLDQFGLEWENNIGGEAIVAQDNATIFVEMSANDWNTVQTKEELTEAILDSDNAGNAFPNGRYTGIETGPATQSYNDYLGVINDDEPYIIYVQNSTVDVGGGGTLIEVTGEYKN